MILLILRLIFYPRNLVADLTSHTQSVGFFTMIAGTCILGNQILVFWGRAIWSRRQPDVWRVYQREQTQTWFFQFWWLPGSPYPARRSSGSKIPSFSGRAGKREVASFTTEDFLILDLIHMEKPILASLRPRLPHLIDHGVIEKVDRDKGVRYIISRQLYSFLGQKGVYTRKRGLDRETNKMLLLKHIQENQRDGSRLQELMQVLPSLSRGQLQSLVSSHPKTTDSKG